MDIVLVAPVSPSICLASILKVRDCIHTHISDFRSQKIAPRLLLHPSECSSFLGLFRAGIAQSSALEIRHGFQLDPKYYAYKFANTIDAKVTPKNTSRELLDFLLTVSPSIISNTTLINPDSEHDTRTFLNERHETVWRPVEESSNDGNAFISGSIYENFRDGKFNHVPVMTGITSEEHGTAGTFDPLKAKLVDENPELLYNRIQGLEKKDKRILGEKMKKMYSTEPLQNNITAFVKLASDMLFGNKVMKFGDFVSKYVDVYFYQFSYFGYMNELPGVTEFQTLKMEGKFAYLQEMLVNLSQRVCELQQRESRDC
nr:unnamed protein product [Callosobruchus analis]